MKFEILESVLDNEDREWFIIEKRGDYFKAMNKNDYRWFYQINDRLIEIIPPTEFKNKSTSMKSVDLTVFGIGCLALSAIAYFFGI